MGIRKENAKVSVEIPYEFKNSQGLFDQYVIRVFVDENSRQVISFDLVNAQGTMEPISQIPVKMMAEVLIYLMAKKYCDLDLKSIFVDLGISDAEEQPLEEGSGKIKNQDGIQNLAFSPPEKNKENQEQTVETPLPIPSISKMGEPQQKVAAKTDNQKERFIPKQEQKPEIESLSSKNKEIDFSDEEERKKILEERNKARQNKVEQKSVKRTGD